MTRFQTAQLQQWSKAVFERAGLTSADAGAVASNLVYAERRGVASHGLSRMTVYLDRICAGGINRSPNPAVSPAREALAIVDADGAAGASTAQYCIPLAVERATKFGVSCVIARNANHFGAAAQYSDQLANHGLVGIVACNTDKIMVPPLGGRAVLGSNPISIALPVPAPDRPQLDMATTAVSMGKLILARRDGLEIPAEWSVGVDGKPTTDPGAGLEGGLQPAGGAKGFGLAFMIDALVALSGARISADVSALYGDPAAPQQLGHLYLAIDGRRGTGDYVDRVSRLVGVVRDGSVGLADLPAAMFPGEPERRRAAARGQIMSLEPALQTQLADLADRYGYPLPDAG